MIATLDNRLLQRMRDKGLLDTQSQAFVIDLIQQGCTLEQATLGSRMITKAEFFEVLADLGIAPETYPLGSVSSSSATRLRSLNTEIEGILQMAAQKDSYEIVFVPTQNNIRVVYGESQEITDLPKSMYPALVMRLRRWSPRLGWEVKDFHTHALQGLRLIRSTKRATNHPVEQSDVIRALKAGQSGLYLFVQPDAYIAEHYLSRPSEDAQVFTDMSDEEIENALHEALFGGTVLVSLKDTRSAWWKPLQEADIPVYLYDALWTNPS